MRGRPPGAAEFAPSPRRQRQVWRREVAREYAAAQGGVVHRAQLRHAGVTRDEVRSEIRAGRWTALGKHTIFLGDPTMGLVSGHATVPRLHATVPRLHAPTEWPARAWWALWESGNRAVLDGTSALLAAGLEHFREDRVHVTLPRGARITPLPGVVVHRPREVVRATTASLPRVPTPRAVVNAAEWAVSDRQAALLVVMPVQQRIVRATDVLAEWRGGAAARGPGGGASSTA